MKVSGDCAGGRAANAPAATSSASKGPTSGVGALARAALADCSSVAPAAHASRNAQPPIPIACHRTAPSIRVSRAPSPDHSTSPGHSTRSRLTRQIEKTGCRANHVQRVAGCGRSTVLPSAAGSSWPNIAGSNGGASAAV
ncbi:MAG: hypothetical protein WDN30_16520 [Pararobbsia sp.]